MKKYSREYHQRPEVKQRRRARYEKHREKTKAWHQANYAKPEVKALKIARAKAHYAANRDRVRARRLMAEFGITVAQYDSMFKQQGGVCVICGRPPKTQRLSVEHDHKTGRVRGLSCHRCNKYKIGSNTIETARKVLAYLESDFDGRKLVA